jgi:hypothetical protein
MSTDVQAATGAVLYVYFKVPLAEHDAWVPRARDFQTALLKVWPGLQAELLQRPEASGGKETWMEVYNHPMGITSEIQAFIEHGAEVARMPMPRHTERFIPLR